MALATIALIVIALAIISKLMKFNPASSLALKTKFENMGNLYGKSFNEICMAVGNPSKQIVNSDGNRTITWETTKYAIALEFDKHLICRKIAGEVCL